MRASARAHANIALVKYWGKRDSRLNLPAVGSISLTLKELFTETTVEFVATSDSDQFILNSQAASPEQSERVSRFLDLIRRQAGIDLSARVTSRNNFPTGAGLASSASAFAALALAASRAVGLSLSPRELSILARQGSGSAARSVFGGFVEMHRGERSDGRDAYAEPLADQHYWDIRLLIAVTDEGEKPLGSTAGMEHTARTAPYYPEWIRSSSADLVEMRTAIQKKDFTRLGELAEFSCLKMHALALSARPGIVYLNGTTVELIHAIRELRHRGTEVYFTIDAGPQVKVLCLPENARQVSDFLKNFPGVQRVLETTPGPGAHLMAEEA